MIKAVLFDMDGVLFDTERLHLRLDEELFAEMGLHMSEEMRVQTFGITDAAFQGLTKKYFGNSFNFDNYLRESYRRFLAHVDSNGLPEKPGARETLTTLREKGYKLALVTSAYTDVAHHFLNLSGFFKYFDAIICGDMVTQSKPAPDIYIFASEKLGVPPANCAVVEDSYAGVQAGAAAGCPTLMVPDVMPPTEEIKKFAALVLPDIKAVPAAVENFL